MDEPCMIRPLKILMVNKFFYVKGGSERYFFELSHLLESKGHTVIPFAMHHPNNVASPYSEYFVEHTEYNTSGFRRWIDQVHQAGKMIYSLHAQKQIEALIQKTRPDIAHLHMIDHQISPSILPVLKKYNIPVIQTVHQYKLVCPNYRLYIPQKREICSRCVGGSLIHPIIQKCHRNSRVASGMVALEAFIHRTIRIYRHINLFHVPSHFMGQKLIEGGIPKDRVAHAFYTIDMDSFPFSSRSEPYYVYVGRLSDEKGILTLIEAARFNKDFRLLIIGDGPQRNQIERIIQDQGLHNIELTGTLDKSALRKIVGKARFLVVPSEWHDNSPLVIYEAFSMGKPVIASNLGGMPELVDHGETGLLFPAGQVESLRDAIRRLMQEPETTQIMGQNARKKAEQLFHPEPHYLQMMGFYKRLLN
ncbi:glycosyltransferase family 4 protein [candidate division KSB1 bacterium]|nr:glycosyltransferase family 4 protein [candidate division KSB1 bacterium]